MLSDADQLELLQVWAEIFQDKTQHGLEFFTMLLTTYPKYIPLFKFLKDVPVDQIRHSKMLRAHGTMFMNSLDAILTNVGDRDMFEAYCEKSGKHHKNMNLDKEDFMNAKRLFVCYLKKWLEEHHPDSGGEACVVMEKAFALLSEEMMKHI